MRRLVRTAFVRVCCECDMYLAVHLSLLTTVSVLCCAPPPAVFLHGALVAVSSLSLHDHVLFALLGTPVLRVAVYFEPSLNKYKHGPLDGQRRPAECIGTQCIRVAVSLVRGPREAA